MKAGKKKMGVLEGGQSRGDEDADFVANPE
jgi:hypothetical protein